MPAPALEATIKSWIGAATTAGTRVSVGSRLQFAALPAVVIEVTGGEDAAIDGFIGDIELEVARLARYDVTIRSIAETMDAASSLNNDVMTKLFVSCGNAGGVAFNPSIRTIDEPIVGDGDEAQPAIVTAPVTIYHRF